MARILREDQLPKSGDIDSIGTILNLEDFGDPVVSLPETATPEADLDQPPELSPEEKFDFLEHTDLCRDLSAGVVTAICNVAAEVHYQADDMLFSEGDIGDSLYFLVDGEIQILKDDVAVFTMNQPRTCIGEMALIEENASRSATVKASASTRMLKISRENFLKIAQQNFQAVEGIFRILNAKLEENLNQAKEKAEEELQYAQTEADNILATAREEANRMTQEAQTQIEHNLQTAIEEGRAQGLEESRDSIVEQTSSLSQTLQNLINEITEFRSRLTEQFEEELLEFVIVTSTKIVGLELSVKPDIIVDIVKSGLKMMEEKSQVLIYLNSEDLDRVKTFRSDLLEQYEETQHIQLSADDKLGLGELRLDNGSNLIDITWQTKVSNAVENIWQVYNSQKFDLNGTEDATITD